MTVSRSTKAVLFTVLVFLACVRVADAKIHDLTIEMDSRSSFAIETFGFAQEGTIKLNVENFAVFGPKGNIVKTGWGKAGFVIRRGETESDASANLELSQERGACLLDDPDNVFKVRPRSWQLPFSCTGSIHPATTILTLWTHPISTHPHSYQPIPCPGNVSLRLLAISQ